MGQLGGVAFAFRGDALHAQGVQLPAGDGGQDHPESQFRKKRVPEGIVFPDVQHPGNADLAPGRVLQGRVIKDAFELVGRKIGRFFSVGRLSQPLFAPVAGDVPPSAGEGVHRQHAMVFAAVAMGGGGFPFQSERFVQGRHGGTLARVVHPGDQRRSEGAHHARDVRAHGLHAADLFKGPQHRLIVEGASLHHHPASQRGGVGELDHLEQGVADHGIGQSGGDILHAGSFLLGLLHVAVHEHRAPGAQVQGAPGKERLGGEALGGIAHGYGEVFQERPAARGAGLVEQDGVHRSVFQLDALHVLAADVQHAVHLRVEKAGGGDVGDGLHLALVQGKGGFHQLLAVTGGAAAGDVRTLRQLVFQFCQGAQGGFERIALVARIIGPQQLPVLADQGQLGGGAARVDAQVAGPGIVRDVLPPHPRPLVAAQKGHVFVVGGKQRLHAL